MHSKSKAMMKKTNEMPTCIHAYKWTRIKVVGFYPSVFYSTG